MTLQEFIKVFDSGNLGGNYVEIFSSKCHHTNSSNELGIFAGNISALRRSKTYKTIKHLTIKDSKYHSMDITSTKGRYLDNSKGQISERFGQLVSMDILSKSQTQLPIKVGGMYNIHTYVHEQKDDCRLIVPVLEITIDDLDTDMSYQDYYNLLK